MISEDSSIVELDTIDFKSIKGSIVFAVPSTDKYIKLNDITIDNSVGNNDTALFDITVSEVERFETINIGLFNMQVSNNKGRIFLSKINDTGGD